MQQGPPQQSSCVSSALQRTSPSYASLHHLALPPFPAPNRSHYFTHNCHILAGRSPFVWLCFDWCYWTQGNYCSYSLSLTHFPFSALSSPWFFFFFFLGFFTHLIFAHQLFLNEFIVRLLSSFDIVDELTTDQVLLIRLLCDCRRGGVNSVKNTFKN